jgi:hypothetical protein
VTDAEQVWAVVNHAIATAAKAADPERQRRLATVVVGGGGATGVELDGGPLEAFRFHGSRPSGNGRLRGRAIAVVGQPAGRGAGGARIPPGFPP